MVCISCTFPIKIFTNLRLQHQHFRVGSQIVISIFVPALVQPPPLHLMYPKCNQIYLAFSPDSFPLYTVATLDSTLHCNDPCKTKPMTLWHS